MANPSNVYIVAVETVAILSLTLISLMGMYKGQNEIAAAAVGAIAGFISHKGLSKASSEKSSDESEKIVKTTTDQPAPKIESEKGLESEIKPKPENKEKIPEEKSEIEEDVA